MYQIQRRSHGRSSLNVWSLIRSLCFLAAFSVLLHCLRDRAWQSRRRRSCVSSFVCISDSTFCLFVYLSASFFGFKSSLTFVRFWIGKKLAHFCNQIENLRETREAIQIISSPNSSLTTKTTTLHLLCYSCEALKAKMRFRFCRSCCHKNRQRSLTSNRALYCFYTRLCITEMIIIVSHLIKLKTIHQLDVVTCSLK